MNIIGTPDISTLVSLYVNMLASVEGFSYMYNPRYAGPAGHQQIINLGQKLAIPMNQSGACHGVIRSGLVALVCGEINVFEKALCAVSQLNVNHLRYSTLNLYQQARTRKGIHNYLHLAKAVPLLQNIAVNQTPRLFSYLFDEYSRESIEQQAVNYTASKPVVISCIIDFLCTYQYDDLLKAITELHHHAMSIESNFGIEMNSGLHSTGIGYEDKQCILLDSNAFPIKRSRSITEITDFIWEAISFDDEEETSAHAIRFTLLVSIESQIAVENKLYDWCKKQDANRMNRIMALSGFHASVLCSQSIEMGYDDVIAFLAAHPTMDVNCTIRLPFGGTLHYAMSTYNIGVVMALFKHKNIDVNLVWNGVTPLYKAAADGKVWAVNLLLAQPDIDTKIICNGETAIDVAHKHGYDEIVTLITNHQRNILERMCTNHKKQKIM